MAAKNTAPSVERLAVELANAYIAAYEIIGKRVVDGNAHFAALKAMEFAWERA